MSIVNVRVKGFFLFPFTKKKKNQQRFKIHCCVYAAIHTGSAPLSVNGIAQVHKHAGGISKGTGLKVWVWQRPSSAASALSKQLPVTRGSAKGWQIQATFS